MYKCDCCKYRNSYDCADGWGLPKDGCEHFVLDYETLDDTQKKIVCDRLFEKEEQDDWDW